MIRTIKRVSPLQGLVGGWVLDSWGNAPVTDEQQPLALKGQDKFGGNTMSQSFTNKLIQLVYSTKDREPLLTEDILHKLVAYQDGIFKTCECPAIVIGGVEDHLHALLLLSENIALRTIIEEVNKGSSKWIKTQGKSLEYFYWQRGYGAFSVSQSNVDAVRKYIETQVEHHQSLSFQDEFCELLRGHRMEFDERYMWV
jgi:REP element-mobilizing transposase RayT